MLRTRNGLAFINPNNVKVEFDQAYNGRNIHDGFHCLCYFLEKEYYISYNMFYISNNQ